MATKKPTKKVMSMSEENAAFLERAYKNNPKARADMDRIRKENAEMRKKDSAARKRK